MLNEYGESSAISPEYSAPDTTMQSPPVPEEAPAAPAAAEPPKATGFVRAKRPTAAAATFGKKTVLVSENRIANSMTLRSTPTDSDLEGKTDFSQILNEKGAEKGRAIKVQPKRAKFKMEQQASDLAIEKDRLDTLGDMINYYPLKYSPMSLKDAVEVSQRFLEPDAIVDYAEDLVELMRQSNLLPTHPAELTNDEAGAIALYSWDYGKEKSDHNPYLVLNTVLRERNTVDLKQLSHFIYLMISGLRKLPRVYPGRLYRGVNTQVSLERYKVGSTIWFRGFSSSSMEISVTKDFLTNDQGVVFGTLFIISGKVWGYDISNFSFFPNEKEILIEPERPLRVREVRDVDQLRIIELEMMDAPLLLETLLPPLDSVHNINVISSDANIVISENLPAPNLSFTKGSVTCSSIMLEYSASTDAIEGETENVQYEIQMRREIHYPEEEFSTFTRTPQDTCVVNKLDCDERYIFRCRLLVVRKEGDDKQSVNAGPWSPELNCATLPPSSKMGHLTLKWDKKYLSSSSIVLEWPLTLSLLSLRRVFFNLQCRPVSNSNHVRDVINEKIIGPIFAPLDDFHDIYTGRERNFNAQKLENDTQYEFRVRIGSGTDRGPWSDSLYMTTPFCGFKPGPHYAVSPNGLIATKNGGDNCFWDTTVLGDREIPANAVSIFSIRIHKSRYSDIAFGLAPEGVNQNARENYSNNGWFFACWRSTLFSGPPQSKYDEAYANTGHLPVGSVITAVVSTLGQTANMSFMINGYDIGEAFAGIPMDKKLYPAVCLCSHGESIEIVSNDTLPPKPPEEVPLGPNGKPLPLDPMTMKPIIPSGFTPTEFVPYVGPQALRPKNLDANAKLGVNLDNLSEEKRQEVESMKFHGMNPKKDFDDLSVLIGDSAYGNGPNAEGTSRKNFSLADLPIPIKPTIDQTPDPDYNPAPVVAIDGQTYTGNMAMDANAGPQVGGVFAATAGGSRADGAQIPGNAFGGNRNVGVQVNLAAMNASMNGGYSEEDMYGPSNTFQPPPPMGAPTVGTGNSFDDDDMYGPSNTFRPPVPAVQPQMTEQDMYGTPAYNDDDMYGPSNTFKPPMPAAPVVAPASNAFDDDDMYGPSNTFKPPMPAAPAAPVVAPAANAFDDDDMYGPSNTFQPPMPPPAQPQMTEEDMYGPGPSMPPMPAAAPVPAAPVVAPTASAFDDDDMYGPSNTFQPPTLAPDPVAAPVVAPAPSNAFDGDDMYGPSSTMHPPMPAAPTTVASPPTGKPPTSPPPKAAPPVVAAAPANAFDDDDMYGPSSTLQPPMPTPAPAAPVVAAAPASAFDDDDMYGPSSEMHPPMPAPAPAAPVVASAPANAFDDDDMYGPGPSMPPAASAPPAAPPVHAAPPRKPSGLRPAGRATPHGMRPPGAHPPGPPKAPSPMTTPEPPKAESPKPEPPKAESPKPEPPKVESPKPEPPKPEPHPHPAGVPISQLPKPMGRGGPGPNRGGHPGRGGPIGRGAPSVRGGAGPHAGRAGPTPALSALPKPQGAPRPAQPVQNAGLPKPQAAPMPKPQAVQMPRPQSVQMPKPQTVQLPKPQAVQMPKPQAVQMPRPQAVNRPQSTQMPKPVSVQRPPQAVKVGGAAPRPVPVSQLPKPVSAARPPQPTQIPRPAGGAPQ